MLCLLLGWSWVQTLGVKRSILAAFCRLAWCSPFILAFYPRSHTLELPRALTQETIHVLVDDSQSMLQQAGFAKSPYQKALTGIETLRSECSRLACTVKTTLLSELAPTLTAAGYTALSQVLPSWISETRDAPWVLFSDGSDFQPKEPWPSTLLHAGLKAEGRRAQNPASPLGSEKASEKANLRGLIYSFPPPAAYNLALSHLSLSPLAFTGQALQAELTISRSVSGSHSRRQSVQVQASLGKEILAAVPAEFSAQQDSLEVSVTLPALPRGQHLLSFQVLATAEEEQTWDNTAYAQVEVMANTLGVLHLLGSPSWDGRFLRRYLKAEPKYDVISFYILRDPVDSQEADEREMSLIPFPVERLFKEELPRFKVLILQNFALLQFLQPAYQQNLVNFVKNGGGLLFLGGSRALLSADLAASPLKEILPFNLDATATPTQGEQQGPWYDSKLAFRVSLAKPSLEQRTLASVYDEWEKLAEPLAHMQGFGLHHMEKVFWPSTGFTPLLQATTNAGQEIPLALASYPGKGRAIWIFSDSLWRFALSPRADTPRELYDHFLQAAMTWLVRQELRPPLLIQDFQLHQNAGDFSWQATLTGPASRYFQADPSWQLDLCGQSLELGSLQIKATGNQLRQLSGSVTQPKLVAPLESPLLQEGERCELKLSGSHPAFGSVTARATTLIPARFKDNAILSETFKLRALHKLSAARLLEDNTASDAELSTWLETVVSGEGLSLPPRFRRELDHYWFLGSAWFWLCLVFLPLEILTRRWHCLRPS